MSLRKLLSPVELVELTRSTNTVDVDIFMVLSEHKVDL